MQSVDFRISLGSSPHVQSPLTAHVSVAGLAVPAAPPLPPPVWVGGVVVDPQQEGMTKGKRTTHSAAAEARRANGLMCDLALPCGACRAIVPRCADKVVGFGHPDHR